MFCRAEDSKPQYMEVPRMTAPCITESPLSQLRQTPGLRTTVSKHSSLVSTQHTSTENELGLVGSSWVRGHLEYGCQPPGVLLLPMCLLGVLMTEIHSAEMPTLTSRCQTQYSIGHLVFNCPKQLTRS